MAFLELFFWFSLVIFIVLITFLRNIVCTDGHNYSSPLPLLRILSDFCFVCDIQVDGMF